MLSNFFWLSYFFSCKHWLLIIGQNINIFQLIRIISGWIVWIDKPFHRWRTDCIKLLYQHSLFSYNLTPRSQFSYNLMPRSQFSYNLISRSQFSYDLMPRSHLYVLGSGGTKEWARDLLVVDCCDTICFVSW